MQRSALFLVLLTPQQVWELIGHERDALEEAGGRPGDNSVPGHHERVGGQ